MTSPADTSKLSSIATRTHSGVVHDGRDMFRYEVDQAGSKLRLRTLVKIGLGPVQADAKVLELIKHDIEYQATKLRPGP